MAERSRMAKVPLPAFIYWCWWPFWAFVLSLSAMFAGIALGQYLWYEEFMPYATLSRLQTYGMINPRLVPGERLQDSGIVEFANGVGLDRSKGGCFVNGRTYCVAPIIEGGALRSSLGDMPSSGGYDYFAVGVDCCSCPNQDFRCGEWNNPLALGGLRSVDKSARPFFKMAVDDWSASYGKNPRHPLFFEWVNNPKRRFALMWSRGMYLALMPCFAAIPLCACIALFLNGVFSVLA